MLTPTTLRFLELVRRELGADDARIELGGREPSDPRLVSASISPGQRVVAVFDREPSDRRAAEARLDALVEAFEDRARESAPPPPSLPPSGQRLDAELAALVSRAGGLSAAVVDGASPVVWGASPAPSMDVAGWRELAACAALLLAADVAPEQALGAGSDLELDDADLRARCARLRTLMSEQPDAERGAEIALARAVAAARAAGVLGHGSLTAKQAGLGVVVRSFGAYSVVIALGEEFSALHAEGALVRALPVIERLVLALPPRDPDDRGARVVRLTRRPRG